MGPTRSPEGSGSLGRVSSPSSDLRIVSSRAKGCGRLNDRLRTISQLRRWGLFDVDEDPSEKELDESLSGRVWSASEQLDWRPKKFEERHDVTQSDVDLVVDLLQPLLDRGAFDVDRAQAILQPIGLNSSSPARS